MSGGGSSRLAQKLCDFKPLEWRLSPSLILPSWYPTGCSICFWHSFTHHISSKKQKVTKAWRTWWREGGRERESEHSQPPYISPDTKEEKSVLDPQKTFLYILLDRTGLCGCPAAKEAGRAWIWLWLFQLVRLEQWRRKRVWGGYG